MREQEIFIEAIKRENEGDLRRFLDEACEGDTVLRKRIEQLLARRDEVGSFLEPTDFSPVDLAVSHVGPYKIREKIGEGGMGVVYVAEQTEPVQRKVAIKIIKPGMDTKEVIARFEAERQALAFMEHPNIARVLDAGATESGRSYFVMELVRGIPITEYCDQVKATPHERLELFRTVCDAVQHAHQKGIIHRDIKPSNVLVTQISAKPVVKVIDFGLAKATSGQKLTDRTVYTGFMKLMGTPMYMSPEQAGLSGLDVDTRSDVYSLGVLLYELLTGTTPLDKTEIQEQAYEELCRKIREVEAPKPSSRISTLKDADRSTIAQQRGIEPKNLRQLLDGDLDVVVLKALEKDRGRRYESPKDLASDVERFLNDQPVLAVPASQFYLARKYFQRHRVAILTAATVVISLVAAACVSTWQAVRANRFAKEVVIARDNAVTAEQLEKRVAERRRRELYAANMQLAGQLWNSPNGDVRKIEELLAAWIPVDDSEDLREFSWRYQWTQLYRGAAVTKLKTIGAGVSAEGNLLTASEAGIQEWAETGTRLATKWSGNATKVTFSPDGRWAAITLDEETQIVNIATGVPAIDIANARCSFSARGQYLAAWTLEAREVQVWRLSGDEPVTVDPLAISLDAEPSKGSGPPQLRGDGRSFLMRGYPGGWQTTMFSDGLRPVTWDHRGQAASCTWSPNGEFLVTTSTLGMLHLRLWSDVRYKHTISSHGTYISALRFSPDGSRLAVGGFDGTIGVWDTSALMEFSDQTEPDVVDTPRSSGGSNKVAAQGTRRTPSIDDSHEIGDSRLPASVRPRLVRSIKAHLSAVRSLSFSADGTKLSSHASGESKLWDLKHRKAKYEAAEFGEDLFSGRLGLSFEKSERGTQVASIDSQHLDVVSGEISVGDRIIEFSDDAHGELTEPDARLSRLPRGPVQSVVTLTVENENHDRNEVVLRRAKKEDPRPMRLCFSPDGTTVAIAGARHGASTINLVTGRTQRFPVSGGFSVAISSTNLLAMDDFTDVLIWDLRKGRQVARLDGKVSVETVPQNGSGGTLAFSPDGRFLAMTTGYPFNPAARQCDLKVWRVSDMKEVGGTPVFKHDRVLSDITFTPDSAYFVTTCHDGIVRIWDTDSWELLDRQIVIGRQSRSIAISPDGKTLATGTQARGRQGQIVLWNFASGKKIRVLSGPTPWALDFSPDGKTLVSGCSNHTVILWNVATGMQLRTIHAHSSAVMGAAFSPDGDTLATVGNEGVLRIWKASSFEDIEGYPTTLNAMFRLGELRLSEDRYEEAEDILVTLHNLQQKQLPPGHTDIELTRELIMKVAEAKRLAAHPPPLNGEP